MQGGPSMFPGSEEGGVDGSGNSKNAVAVVSIAATNAGAQESRADMAEGADDERRSNSGYDKKGRGEESDKNSGKNRWPKQETTTLLNIRSDMDVAFRGSTFKGPLWEEISRKLAEHGYHRDAKKCKEKFENVYKYHKRTKDGRSGKSDGKAYRFCDQLEAIEAGNRNSAAITHHPPSMMPSLQAPLQVSPVSVVVTSASLPHHTFRTTTVPMFSATSYPTTTTAPSSVPFLGAVTVQPTPAVPISIPQPILNVGIGSTPSLNLTNPSIPPPPNPPHITPISFPNIPIELLSGSSSFSTSSDDTSEGGKRKRKRKDFAVRLLKEVIEKHQEFQRRFFEYTEKKDQEKTAREEAWRMQEMQRINREMEVLSRERAMAAAREGAIIASLEKIAEKLNLGQALNNNITFLQQQNAAPVLTPLAPPASASALPMSVPTPSPTPAPVIQATSIPQAMPVLAPTHALVQPVGPVLSLIPHHVSNVETVKTADNGGNSEGTSSSRWPKTEVLALIRLRTSMDAKYQENGPKGPLWEEISKMMKNKGYNRNAKRCKEKWENINKYYKKVKESNKTRPEDSKTCPYFHELDAIYTERNRRMRAPLMVQPEQQWPPQQQQLAMAPTDVAMEDVQNDPVDGWNHEDDEDNDNDRDMEDDDEDDEGGANNYEIVASKPAASSLGTSNE